MLCTNGALERILVAPGNIRSAESEREPGNKEWQVWKYELP